MPGLAAFLAHGADDRDRTPAERKADNAAAAGGQDSVGGYEDGGVPVPGIRWRAGLVKLGRREHERDATVHLPRGHWRPGRRAIEEPAVGSASGLFGGCRGGGISQPGLPEALHVSL